MASGFISVMSMDSPPEWEQIGHTGSGHFEFFKVRRFGALHFVKRPSKAYRHDLVTTESLKKEFYIGYNLNHPSIVRYMRMEEGAIYEEYIDGLTLREMIDNGDQRLRSPEFIERICRQLMDATAYLHSRGVIHNDIKPENVMIARIGDQLKLVDLGCAYTDMWDATQGYTPAYKAPEQESGATNVYTDIFLIGKLMEELAPIAGVSRKWKKFVTKATADDIADRFGSDNEAIASIPRQRHILWPGIVVAVVFVIGGIVFFGININDKEIDDEAVIAKGEIATDSVAVAIDSLAALPPQDAELPDSKNEDTLKPQSKIATVSGNSEIPISEATPKETVDKKLKEYVTNIYEKKVFPECRKYEKLPDAVARYRQNLYIRFKVMQNAVDDVQAYAETLAASYPSEAEYARMQSVALLEAQQSRAAIMLEKSYQKFSDERVDPDSADAIMREFVAF